MFDSDISSILCSREMRLFDAELMFSSDVLLFAITS